MRDSQLSEEKPEDRVRDLFVTFTHTTSRKGFLAWVFKIALSALGISLLPVLPVDRSSQDAEACTTCSDCKLCNICGDLCGCYGGSLTSCPSCAFQGSNWGGCCPCGPSRYLMSYIDCCAGIPNQCQKSGTCTHCCPKTQLNWCGGSNLQYICTLAVVQGFC